MISGFRVARGGAQELLGIEADLTVMGKVLGGGLPAAAYGGSRELMERIAPAGDVYQAGTLSGQPAGGGGGTRHAPQARRRRLRPARRRSRSSWPPACARAAGDRAVQVSSVPGLVTVFFSADPVRDFAGAQACDTDAYGRFCRALLERGVYPPASQFEAWFPSLAHDDEAIERTIDAAGEAFEQALELTGALISHLRHGVDRRPPSPPWRSLLRDGENVISPYVATPTRSPRSGPGRRRARGPPRRPGSTCSWSRRSGRATCCTTRRLGWSTAPTRTCALLAGDYLYALGLERLAGRGDLEAVGELADLISLAAQVHAENGDGSGRGAGRGALARGDASRSPPGRTPEHERAKEALRAGSTRTPTDLLLGSARRNRRPGGPRATLWRAQPSR